jgi:hypothetical protein
MEKKDKLATLRRAVSIDIGAKNFCLYIETFNIDNLHKITNIPKNKRYEKDNTPTPAFRKILNEVYREGKKELLEKVDISGKSRTEMLVNLTIFLDSHKKLLDSSDLIMIEEQKKENNQARCLEQHCYSYFIFNYSDTKPIIIFKSRYKTQILGMKKYDKGLKAYQKKKIRKDWTVTKSGFIFKLRNDQETLDQLNTKGKKDDESDTICQLQALKYIFFVDKKRVFNK